MHGLTEIPQAATKRPVGRIRINDEQTPARFPEGTLARIDATLEGKEKRSDFIRGAVERELARRERITRNPPSQHAPARLKDAE
jgi:hypothetical protein